MFKCVISIILIMLNEWQMQDFPHGGAPTPKIAIIFQSLAKKWMKMKEFVSPWPGHQSRGCACFAEILSEFTKTRSSDTTECRVWIGNCNVKVLKSTEHKLQKIRRSLKFNQNDHTPGGPSPLGFANENYFIFRERNKNSKNREVLWSDRTENGTKTFEEIFPNVCWHTQQYYLLFSTVGAIYYSAG